MTISDANHPAHLAGKRSRAAVAARDKDAWLAVFADDAIVQDPIGPSLLDPDGNGHRGKEANVGSIVTTMGGHRILIEGVFTYRVNDAGQMVALRAF